MASQSIDTKKNLTADIYGINDYVNEIRKRFTPTVNEDTMMLGIFGYTGQIFSDMYQNSIVMASEFSKESIPTEAKFEKNIIAHALGHGITDINAIPAQMDVLLTFVEDDIIEWAHARNGDGIDQPYEFIFDKDTPIYIGDYCFHVDYDIQIRKILLKHSGKENQFTYTAKYLIDVDNPVSDITNPYLTSPVRMNVNGINVIYTKCTIRQVTKSTIHKKILSDNSIASKTTTFEFEGQLAAFTVDITEGGKTTHLIPVYEGLSVENKKYPYFWYTYLDAKTIRIKFDRYSYAPRINSDLEINIQTTEGEDGNFTFDPNVYPGFAFESEKYAYSNIACEIRPITGESAYGANKKSIEDLKQLIPKEALSRGSITNLADLQNYFNSINTDYSTMYLYKKRDNALTRLYYTYIIMKDNINNVIPTNTIDIKISPKSLLTEDGHKLVFKKGQVIKLRKGEYGELYTASELEPDYDEVFYYVIPYNFIINMNPLYGMYYLSIIDSKKFLDFYYINESSIYQYISTNIHMYRGYLNNPDTYEATINIEQNIKDNKNSGVVEYDPDTGEISKVNIRVIAIFYNEEDEPLRWAEAKFISYNAQANIFSYRFTFTTQDYIDVDNRIRIDTGLYELGTTNEFYAHLNGSTKCIIHIFSTSNGKDSSVEYYDNLAAFPETGELNVFYIDNETNTQYIWIEAANGNPARYIAFIDTNGVSDLVPNLYGATLTNSYLVVDGLDFFHDYSEIINSTVIAAQDPDTKEEVFTIEGVPVVKYGYFDTEDKVMDFCKELVKRKTYIDYAIEILEDAFGIDFKFFNTYGPSCLYTLDNKVQFINRTNITLTFRLKLNPNYESNIINDIIADIKSYIEDINSINSLHMPNLITEITTNYRDYLEYFEFIDMNGYGPSIQHIYNMEMPAGVVVPEFININTLNDGTPDIQLIIE